MKNRTIILVAALCSIALAGCDADPEQPFDEDEQALPRINNYYVDGEPAELEEQGDGFQEELNASLLQTEDDSDVEFRAHTCVTDCGGGTAMTCNGSAGCASIGRSCTSCDWTFDDDPWENPFATGVDCWTFTCGGRFPTAPSTPAAPSAPSAG